MNPYDRTPVPPVKRPPVDSIRAVFWRNVYLAAVKADMAPSEALIAADSALHAHDLRFSEAQP